jgi:hypothetical protein
VGAIASKGVWKVPTSMPDERSILLRIKIVDFGRGADSKTLMKASRWK